MNRDGGRHSTIAAHWEPRTPELLREVLEVLKEEPDPEPPLPQRRRVADPRRIAAALAAESDVNPAWTHAVVFGTSRPVCMDINGGVDYYLFPGPRQARKVMRDDQSLTDPQLWARRGGRWHPAGPGTQQRRGEA